MPGSAAETIRPATPADIPRLRELFVEVFHEDRPEAVWAWKYFDAPYESASYVCEAEGRFVAHCGGIAVNISGAPRPHRAFQSVDFMSTSAYAGGMGRGGVFLRTAQRLFAERCGPDSIPMVYGFPGERHRLLGERILGYRPIEKVGEWTLPTASAGFETCALTDGFLRSFDREAGLAARRDLAYLDWRYRRHPSNQYLGIATRRHFFRESTTAILRETDSELLVMELGGNLNSRGIGELARILGRAAKPVRLWAPLRHRIGMVLAGSAFQPSERDHFVECRFFDGRPTPQAGQFYYSLGDYDVY